MLSQEGQSALRAVLVGFSVHFPHIGYCQGLNHVTAILLLCVDKQVLLAMTVTGTLCGYDGRGGVWVWQCMCIGCMRRLICMSVYVIGGCSASYGCWSVGCVLNTVCSMLPAPDNLLNLSPTHPSLQLERAF